MSDLETKCQISNRNPAGSDMCQISNQNPAGSDMCQISSEIHAVYSKCQISNQNPAGSDMCQISNQNPAVNQRGVKFRMEGMKRHPVNMNSTGDDRPHLLSLLPLQEIAGNEKMVEMMTSCGSENSLDSPVIVNDDSTVDGLDESSSGDNIVTPERSVLLKSGRSQKHSPIRSYSQSSGGSKIVFTFLNTQKKVITSTRVNHTPRSISEMNLFEQQQIQVINSSRPVAPPIISVDSPYGSNNKENMPLCKEDSINSGLVLNSKMSSLNIGVPKLAVGRNVNPLSLSTDCIFGRLDDSLFNSPPTRFSDKGRLQAEAENIRRNTRISPRKYKLETLSKTSQPELNCLCPETVAKLVQGEYNDLYEKIIIIDCRFEYEYIGGHIKGALNFPKEDDVDKYFIKENDYHKLGEKLCLVFHCEFSSHRGPKSYKRIRSNDRKINESNYPDLYYPEMYLLEGGYKQFFKDFPELCEPQAYVEMKDPLYIPEMRMGMQGRGRSKSQRRFFSQSCSSITLELDKSKTQEGDKEPVVPMTKNHTARQ